jgi:hypothetical protein
VSRAKVPGPFRAYWCTAQRWGIARATIGAAVGDGYAGSDGPLGVTLTIAAEDPEVPGRTVEADTGLAIWPLHGRSSGALRWPATDDDIGFPGAVATAEELAEAAS